MTAPVKYPVLSLKLGLKKKLRCLHISDTHLLFTDGRDNEAKYKIAIRRYGEYTYSNRGRNLTYFLDALLYVQKNADLLLHTGDLIDFYSPANLEAAERLFKLSGINYFICAGNHEYTNYSGQHRETPEEKAQARNEVPKIFRNNINQSAKIIGGINFIALECTEHLFSAESLAFFEREAARDYPMVLLIHCPIYTPALAKFLYEKENQKRMFLAGCPEKFPWKDAKCVTTPDKPTTKFIERIKQEPLLKLILAGHVHGHENFVEEVRPGLMQVTVGGGYYGCGQVIDFD